MKIPTSYSGFVSGSFKNSRRSSYDNGQVYYIEEAENDEIEVYHMDKSKHYGRFVFDRAHDCYTNTFRCGIPYFRVGSTISM